MIRSDDLVAARHGDDEAFCKLIEVYQNRLFRIALAYFNQEREDALDAGQETVYRAYIHIKKVKEVQYFETWLTRILLNYCNDELKRRKKVRSEIHLHTSWTQSAPPVENIDLQEALKVLAPKHRNVVILKYFEQFTFREIAEILGRSENTIKTWNYKALVQLKQKLGYTRIKGGENVEI